jgi:hypothetical protein
MVMPQIIEAIRQPIREVAFGGELRLRPIPLSPQNANQIHEHLTFIVISQITLKTLNLTPQVTLTLGRHSKQSGLFIDVNL